jgi:hypothetical protein
MGRERVPELEDRLVQVVAPALAREPITVDARDGEEPVPGPLAAGARILPSGYASGANNPRRVMVQPPLSIATRQP